MYIYLVPHVKPVRIVLSFSLFFVYIPLLKPPRMLSVRRQAEYWLLSLTSTLMFQILQRWPVWSVLATSTNIALNIVVVVAIWHRIIVSDDRLEDSLLLRPEERAQIATLAYRYLLTMLLVSLGYCVRYIDNLYHVAAEMESTNFQREVLIHVLLGYIVVAEIRWVRHGVSFRSFIIFSLHDIIQLLIS